MKKEPKYKEGDIVNISIFGESKIIAIRRFKYTFFYEVEIIKSGRKFAPLFEYMIIDNEKN